MTWYFCNNYKRSADSRENHCTLLVSMMQRHLTWFAEAASSLYCNRQVLPSKLLKMIVSFHLDMKDSAKFNGSSCQPFHNFSGMKQGCVLVPTLFGILFSLLLFYCMYIHTRGDGSLFNLATCVAQPKSVQPSLGKVCLQTMPHWLPILTKSYSDSLTILFLQ